MTLSQTTPTMEKVRVLIVDDHPTIRDGLRAVLNHESGFEVCGDVGTIAAAFDLVHAQSPHVAVIDLNLDKENGLDLIQTIKRTNQSVRMLAYSMYDDLHFAERSLVAGAMGYLNKRAKIGCVADAIRVLIAGGVYLADGIKQQIAKRASSDFPARLKTDQFGFSDRQMEIFQLFERGFTSIQVGGILNLSESTINVDFDNIQDRLRLAAR